MTRRGVALLLAALASGALTASAMGQGDLVTAMRAGTARYRDLAAAIADGYRQIGPDFPTMGEHWVNAGLLVGGVLDPARPQVLEFASINGRPTLIGVAYAALVTDTVLPNGLDRKSTRLNSSHSRASRMPSSA